MKRNCLILSYVLLSIMLVGCQQSSEEKGQNTNVSKPNETLTNKVTNENYDITGVVTEIRNKRNDLLLDLTTLTNEDEKQMWIRVGDNVEISKGNEDSVFENIKINNKLKVNLGDRCLESNPRICFAEEIVIE